MSPAAGGAAASFDPAPAPTAAIGATPHHAENLRDPAFHADGADPGNAAARKPAWNVPPPPAAPVGGGIIGGDESWPALTDSAPPLAPTRAWPKSASSDSLSDGSAPSAPEDSVVVPSVPSPSPSQPVSNPISTAPSPASTPPPPPPPSAATTAPSPQNGGPSRPDLVRHGGGQGGNNGGGGRGGNNGGADHGGNGGGGGGGGSGSTRSRSTGNNSSDGNSSSGGDGNWNDGGLGGGSSNMNSSVHSGGTGGSGIDSGRRVFGSNNWNGNGRGGSYNNGSGDDGNRNNGGGRGWNNNGRSGSGSSNGFGGRGGGRNRRDHDRGGNFSPRNYSRHLPAQQQQQQPSFYQPGPFQRPPPPPPAAHFMMPQPFLPYAPPFAYPGDVQNYPFYVTPLEQQFQNMHLIQQQMQPLGAQQDQLSLQRDIQQQIEHYFSTNNLCHDTHLRGRMDDQGWVPIDLIASFPKVTRFLMLGVDTNYILDSLQGSELVEVQGNNIRRRNDWAAWLLHRRPPPSN